MQPENKEKVSNIVKESLKNENSNEKITENSLSVPLKEAREKFEKEYLTIQLKKFNGNISKTAKFVGMERSALHRKLKGLGIKEFKNKIYSSTPEKIFRWDGQRFDKIWSFTDYEGIDPEIYGGIDNNFYPRPQTGVFGVTFEF